MSSRLLRVLALCAAALVPVALRAQTSFPSPEAGANALFEALRTSDDAGLRTVLGRRGADLLALHRPSEEQPHERFLAAYAAAHRVVRHGDSQAVLEVGKDAWPFPIPLVKTAAGWHFDAQLGEKEVLARRIGRNELAAIQVALAIGDAEHEYASVERDNDNVLEYSPRFVSAPGKQDGLYWESAPGEPLSPLGRFVAAAGLDRASAKAGLARAPFHGYYYRILTRQGPHAKGGAYSYIVHGQMIGGFAVLAYPARYGASGVKTFMVGQDGQVFEKDLGANTGALATKIQSFDPDPSWTKTD